MQGSQSASPIPISDDRVIVWFVSERDSLFFCGRLIPSICWLPADSSLHEIWSHPTCCGHQVFDIRKSSLLHVNAQPGFALSSKDNAADIPFPVWQRWVWTCHWWVLSPRSKSSCAVTTDLNRASRVWGFFVRSRMGEFNDNLLKEFTQRRLHSELALDRPRCNSILFTEFT